MACSVPLVASWLWPDLTLGALLMALCSKTVVKDGQTVSPNPATWVRQDQLLLHAIIASVSESVMPLITSAKTSHEAWTKLGFMQIDLVQEWWILRSGSLAVARNQTCGRILATDKGYLWWVSHHWHCIGSGRYHYSCSQWPVWV